MATGSIIPQLHVNPVVMRATGGAPNSCVSAQIALVVAGAAAIGLLDAALVVAGIGGARGAFQFVPARIWVAAPLVWLLLAAIASAAALPLLRKWGGVCVPAALGVLFLVIRLRTRPALLCATLLGLLVVLALTAKSFIRWSTKPRRPVAAAVLGGLAMCAVIAFSPRVTRARAAADQGAPGPNVVIIFLDTVRHDAVVAADGQVHPELETLSRLSRHGVTFTRAYAPSPWTLPSHLSAITGLPAHELGVSFDWQVYDRSTPTLAERFARRGYRTAAVISNSFLNRGSGFARGFGTFQQAQAGLDFCRTAPGVVAEASWPWFAAAVCNWTAGEVTKRALALMDDAQGPFLLMLNYMDAHDPYYVERACGAASGYRAAIECIDRNLASIVDWRSARRPTVLAVVGDHGEQFGEHGLFRHGNSLYLQLLQVPLIVRLADSDSARRYDEPISLAALPSLLDAANVPPRQEEPVLALLHPPAASNLQREWSALDGVWHLIVRERGDDELYHLPTDLAEEHNLISSNSRDPAVLRLRTAIGRMRTAPTPDPRRFRSLGYVH